MAADQIMKFLETGTIKNSVNFPAANLEKQGGDSTRLCIINENVPGMPGELMSVFGEGGLNILQQVNMSRGDIAYNVIDLDSFSEDEGASLQEAILAIEGVLSTRIIWTGSAMEGPSNFLTKM